jgi:ribosomal protein S20
MVESDPGSPETTEQVKNTLRLIDKTASKGVFHGNTAARRKSRLVARFKKAVQTEK